MAATSKQQPDQPAFADLLHEAEPRPVRPQMDRELSGTTATRRAGRHLAPWLCVATAGLVLGGCGTDESADSSSTPPSSSSSTTTPPRSSQASPAVATTTAGSAARTTTTVAPIDTSSWLPFVSERYGYSIAYPPDWSAHQGRGDWTFPDDTAWPAGVEVSDWFYLEPPDAPSVAASVWSVRLEPGTSADEWFLDYCAIDVTPCDGNETWTAASLAGHAGRLVRASDPLAYFEVGDKIYMLAVWQPDDIVSLEPYGGGARLLEALLTTMRLLPNEPSTGADQTEDLIGDWLDTSTWATHVSKRYPFTIGHPADWTVIESSHHWNRATDSINWDSGGAEVFVPPDDTLSIYLAAWSVEVPPLTTLADWVQDFCDDYVGSCTDVEGMSEPASAGAGEHEGILLSWDDGMVAFFPSWYDEVEARTIWEQPAPAADARIEIIESGRPDSGPYHSREFIERFAASLCVDCGR
jgi:hypothetical protein